MENERTWGVTPVPDRLRTLTLSDLSLLWGNLGISLLVLVAGYTAWRVVPELI